MSTDEPGDDTDIEPSDVRAELDRQQTRAEGMRFDDGIVDLLSCVLDTDTRTRIYVHLRKQPSSTIEEIAEGTGLYPNAINRVLSDLHDEGVVERTSEESDDPAYTAIPPNELIEVLFGQVRDGLFGRRSERRRGRETEPVTIPVEKEDDEDDER